MQSLYRRGAKRFSVMGGLFMLAVGVPLVYAGVNDFASQTNGFESQSAFDTDRLAFEAIEDIDAGLGPLYNMRSCSECHQNAITGTGSQIGELLLGRSDDTTDLISDRAIDAAIQERFPKNGTKGFRVSLNVLGDGFVEALPDSEFTTLQAGQPVGMRGTIIRVPVLEGAPGTTRIARFGWKNQHASLLSFSAEAYRNEMGITNPLVPAEKKSNGHSVAAFDTVPDPEDAATPGHPFGPDVEAFTRFMRSTKAPERDSVLIATPEAEAGRTHFFQAGCQVCHATGQTTAAAGTVVNGGTFTVPAALAGKTLFAYSDFMLHDVGTGDGTVQNGFPETRDMFRTAPLWGVRTRNRLMHDGQSVSLKEAIQRHAGQAQSATDYFNNTLTGAQKDELYAFLNSL